MARGDSDGAVAATVLTVVSIGALMAAFGRVDPRQPRAARDARGAGDARRRRGAAADRARPPRPARPQPVRDRAQERARGAAARARPRPRGGRAGGDPGASRARRSPRCARRSRATAGSRSPTSLDARAHGARRGRHRLRARRRAGGAAGRRRRRARLGGPRGHDERHPPQRRAPLRDPHPRRPRERRARDRRRRPRERRGRPRRQRARRACASARSACAARSRPARGPRAASGCASPSRCPSHDPRPDRRGPGDGPRRARQPARARGRHRGRRRGRPRRRGARRRRARARPTWRCSTSRCPAATASRSAGELARELPRVRTLILTTFGRPGYLRRALENGARGFLLKDAPARELAAAIRTVDAGGRAIDPALAAATITEGESPLTAREHDVLRAAMRHDTAADIAARAAPLGGHGAQLPQRGDPEARRPQPPRGDRARGGEGLAVMWARGRHAPSSTSSSSPSAASPACSQGVEHDDVPVSPDLRRPVARATRPDPHTPPTTSIRLVQVVRTEDLHRGGEHAWGGAGGRVGPDDRGPHARHRGWLVRRPLRGRRDAPDRARRPAHEPVLPRLLAQPHAQP